MRVRFLGFGMSSLDVELFAYVVASDYNQFLQTQEDLLLNVMEIVQAAGTQLAYPSQTLYLTRSNGLSATERDAPPSAETTEPSAHLLDVR